MKNFVYFLIFIIFMPIAANATLKAVVGFNTLTPTQFGCTGGDQTTEISNLLNTDGNYLFTGTCKTTAITKTNKNLIISFAQGATLQPYSKIDVLWKFTGGNITLGRINIDGNGLAQTGLFLDGTGGGNLYTTGEPVIINNMGYPVDLATALVAGIQLRNYTITHVAALGEFSFTGYNSIGNGACGDALGSMRGLYMSDNAIPVDIYSINAAGGYDTEDGDYVQAQLNTVGGVIHHFYAAYNNNSRRVFKRQSGDWVILDAQITEGSDFTPFSGSTQIGKYNLNAFDQAGAVSGSMTIVSGYLDCSGFDVCVANSGGVATVKTGPGVTMFGPTLTATRDATNCNSALSGANTIGFLSNGSGAGPNFVGVRDTIDGSTIQNFGIGAVLAGVQATSINAKYVDPVFEAAELAGSTARDGAIFKGNDIVTITPGNLNNTRIVRVLNAQDVILEHNRLLENGNTSHAATFIGVTSSGATGYAFNNFAPSGTTPVDVSTSAIVDILDNSVLVNANIPTPFNASKAITSGVAAATDSSGTWSTDASLGNVITLTFVHGETVTISNPTSPTNGQRLIYRLKQSSTGSDTITTWASAFNFGAAGSPTLSTGANKIDNVGFVYDSVSAKWEYLGSELGF